MKIFSKVNPLIAVVAVVAIVAALLVTFWPGSDKKYVVADFPRTVSLYEGSDVKILGVAVGKVDTVTPAGTKVRVKLHYDAKYDVPADAKAAVISPSIVGDRFVQLTPAYSGGAKMADNARLGIDKTATPARARRDLQQPQRPQHRARPRRGQQGRRRRRGSADPAARLHRPQLRWPGRGVQQDPEELRRLHQDAGRQQGRAVRHPGPGREVHQHARQERPDRARSSTTRWPEAPTCWPTSARTWRPC